MSVKKYPANQIKVNGEEITYHRINNTVNGVPRYVVHFLSLGIQQEHYGKIPGLTKYRAKWFGGGIVFQSFNLESDLKWHLEQVAEFYKDDIAKSQQEMIDARKAHIRKEAPWIL